MKLKRIVESVLTVLILLSLFISQQVLAVETLSPAKLFVEMNLDNSLTEKDYWVDNDVMTGGGKRIFVIGEKVGNSITRKQDIYCGGYDRGFTSRPDQLIQNNEDQFTDTYTTKYNMNDANDNALIQTYTYDTRDKILALADLFYVGNDFDTYGTNILNAAYADYSDILYDNDYTYESLRDNPNGYLITEDQVRAVQQLALWYFTNNDKCNYKNITESMNASFLYEQTVQNGPARSLSNGTQAEKIQNVQALALYKYLVNTAEENASIEEHETNVYLYLNPTDPDYTQPLIEIVPNPKRFDLALRKFITKLNGADITTLGYESREPRISSNNEQNRLDTSSINEDEYTAKKEHTKTPLSVEKGDRVTYKIRIYNEGQINGYATEITDHLPDGLTFDKNSTLNSTYRWTNPSNDGKTIITDYLKNVEIKAANRDFSKFTGNDKTDYYKDLEIECIVSENATNANMKNIAEITGFKDKKGNTIDDDSQEKNVHLNPYAPTHPTTGRGEQDDDDFEELRLKQFDLALRKYISKVDNTTYEVDGKRKPNVNTSKLNRGDVNLDNVVNNEDLKVVQKYLNQTITLTDEQKFRADFNGDGVVNTDDTSAGYISYNLTTAIYEHQKNPIIVNTGSLVTYKLVIYNEGEVDGRATKVVDQLPAGVKYKSIVSGNYTGSYVESTNTLTLNRKSTATTDLKAFKRTASGDTLDYEVIEILCEVIATADLTNDKIYTNMAWIAEHTSGTGNNEHHYTDRDSVQTTPDVHPDKNALVTNDPNKGYLGNTSNANKNWESQTEYFEGQEDDDDFEKIKILHHNFDLALRKFITNIKDADGKDATARNYNFNARKPVIGTALDQTHEVKENETTYEKKHSKVPMLVCEGDIVTYTIRIYNEGDKEGTATRITDFLPEGLELYNGGTINGVNGYNWKVDSSDSTGRTFYTTYLADNNIILQPCSGNSSKLNQEGYYKDVQIQCRVTGNSNKLKNVAEITEDSDDDNDSIPGEGTPVNELYKNNRGHGGDESDGRGYEDDDDFEDLKLLKFDLALRKYIEKVEYQDGNQTKTINNLGRAPVVDASRLNIENGLQTAIYKHKKDPVEVLPNSYVYYRLTVYNEGDIEGYATEITDQLPAGVEFVEVVDENGKRYSKKTYDTSTNILVLENTEQVRTLSPYNGNGNVDNESVLIKCKVTATKETGSDKIYTNLAWISGDTNDYNVNDRDSQPEEPANHPNKNQLVTDSTNKGYLGKSSNSNKNWSSATEYFEGQQDDDDFEKITIFKDVEIHKGVKDIRNQDSGYDDLIDTPHDWIINSTVPKNIDKYTKYTITDDIDYRLAFVTGSVKVWKAKTINADGTPNQGATLLTAGTDYKLEYTPHSGNDVSQMLGQKYSGRLQLTFIDTENGRGIDKLEDVAGGYIIVRYNTRFTRDENGDIIALGKELPNTAELDYTNIFWSDKKKAETPEVHTGGITFLKYENINNQKIGLEGAEFKIYRTEADAIARRNEIMTEESDANGLVKFQGLEYGEDAMDNAPLQNGLYDHDSNLLSTEYWVVETGAPVGYMTNQNPIKVEINNDSFQNNIEVLIREEESKENPVRLIENTPIKFDLSLRKHIEKVEYQDGNQTKTIENLGREPSIDTSKLDVTPGVTTATYKHRKDPVEVLPNSYVYYRLTVYNEGNINGHATEITDQLPDGVEFVNVVNENGKLYDMKSYDKTTNILVLQETNNIIDLAAHRINQNLDSASVLIKCKVIATSQTGSDKIYTNLAWISGDTNSYNANDRDSQPVEPANHPNKTQLVTDVPEKGYLGNNENNGKDWTDSAEYFKGQQDDDDFEKIVIFKAPEIHKGVKDIRNQDSGYDDLIDTPHDWIINSTVPKNIEKYTRYVITDDIDYRLAFVPESIQVWKAQTINEDGTPKTPEGDNLLEEGVDYTLEYTEHSGEDISPMLGQKYSGRIKLTFIDNENGKTASEKMQSVAGGYIVVRYNTRFTKDENGDIIALGKELPNTSELEYTNIFWSDTKKAETPEVHTGGITLFKYENKDNKKVGLKDAEFKVYRTEADAIARQNEVMTEKSDVNGLVKFQGLEYGEDAMDNTPIQNGLYDHDSTVLSTDYWVVETKVPVGYKTIEDPIRVTINSNSFEKNISVLISDYPERLIENIPLKFDLALRKYIIKVEDETGKEIKENNINREPTVDTETLKSGTTATYKHRKDPVVVKPNYYIYYRLSVYNEGEVAGYAKTITDKLPAGVEFVEVVDEDGKLYDMKSYDNKTNILVLEATENVKTLSEYDGSDKLDSESVLLKCKVTADEKDGSEKIYTNIAWISEDYNELGITDRDSSPEKYPEEEKLVTDKDDKGYIGNKENENKDWTNSNEYFKGEEDDDDFEKIIIYKGPEIHKGVKEVINQDSGYDDLVSTPHEWVIQSSLPTDIKDYKKYIVVDDIDYRLVYGKIKSVNVIDNTGKVLAELKENEDYKQEYTPHTGNDKSSMLGEKYVGTLKLTFIEDGFGPTEKLTKNAGNKIEIRFNTTFAKDEKGRIIALGIEIPNTSELHYSNNYESEGKLKTETPEVHTGGITLFKYTNKNGKKVGLEDAEFAIYRTEADAKTKKNAVMTATSNENGLIRFEGLEYGEDAMDDEKYKTPEGLYDHDSTKLSTPYWVVETKAPKGYKTITDPIKVVVNNDTYQENVEVLIKEEESKEVVTRLVENKPLEFDLALRKFIIDINGKAPEVSREPVVDTTDLASGKSTTATYTHPKDPLDVVNGNVVTYTLRIFNEGPTNGYASIITDDIPEGLQFVPENNINKEYRWVMYEEVKDESKVTDKSKIVECKVKDGEEVKKFVETKDPTKASIIRTDYLSKEQGAARMKEGDNENPNLLKAFEGETLDYKDVKLAFKVIEPNGSKKILINYAQISEDTDENGDEVDDRDSTPNRWNEGEDDQDIEKVKLPIFDLALRKWVTQAIVIENGKESVTKTGHDAWDDPEQIVKVELHRKKLTEVEVKFRYSIRVYNQGEIAGYAKEITDYIPAGLKFLPEDNKGWKDEGNNVISTRKLENTLLQPGQYADVEVVLTWIKGTDNLGLKVNTAEISEDYNEKGVPDRDSTPDNKKPGEDDIDDAPVMLSVTTGSEATYIGLTFAVLIVVAGGLFLIRKYVL